MPRYDVIVVGGGPAGLSAATILGRCCRSVLVVDAGDPRNSRSRGVHGFLTRDGILPAELLTIARRQLERYPVELLEGTVMSAETTREGFRLKLLDGAELESRKLLLATGLVDRLPSIDGFAEFYGRSVHHCPYCDGWEHRNEPVAVYGRGRGGVALALTLTTWTRDIVLLSDGPARLGSVDKERLKSFEIALEQRPVKRLCGTAGQLESVEFASGDPIRRVAMFFSTGLDQRSNLVDTLGCVKSRKGDVKTDRSQRSSVPGVFVAGDAAQDAHLAIVAAAHGARAAVAINVELQEETGRMLPRQESER